VDLSAFSHEAVLVWSSNLSARAFEVSNPSLSTISHSGDTLMSEALSKKEISGGVVHDLCDLAFVKVRYSSVSGHWLVTRVCKRICK
jgi:hypothetical protein